MIAKFDAEDVKRYGTNDAASWGNRQWHFGTLPKAARFYMVAVCEEKEES